MAMSGIAWPRPRPREKKSKPKRDDAAFDRILHDPPVLELAGDLYGGAFYQQLRRVLAPRGRLFHYVGNPDSPSGSRVSRGVVRRLEEAGFQDVRLQPDAFGISARV